MVYESKRGSATRKVSVAGISQSIGARIQALRERKSWKQIDLARATGFDPGFISYIESGKKVPSLEGLIKFALALEVTPSTLLDVPEFRKLEAELATKRGADRDDRRFYEKVGRLVYGRFLATKS